MNNRNINILYNKKVKRIGIRGGISPTDLGYLIASYFDINLRVVGLKDK